MLPDAILLTVAAEEAHAHFPDRVVGAHEDLGLDESVFAIRHGTKRNPAGEGVALGGHEGEGLIVGVDDHYTSGKLDAAGSGGVDESDFTGGQASERGIEVVAGHPEICEVLFPGTDHIGRAGHGGRNANAVGFLPHWAEAL